MLAEIVTKFNNFTSFKENQGDEFKRAPVLKDLKKVKKGRGETK